MGLIAMPQEHYQYTLLTIWIFPTTEIFSTDCIDMPDEIEIEILRVASHACMLTALINPLQ